MDSFKEFQPIIMAAGKGTRMTELTAEKPKCLLPVGNLPMVWYPLQLLQRTKFKDTIIVVTDVCKNEIQNALEQYLESEDNEYKLNIKIDFFAIPSEKDLGTADSLRLLYAANKIKNDVLVISCDLITDSSLSGAINLFRQHGAALTALFFASGIHNSNTQAPGRKKRENKPERDLIGIDPATSRFVVAASASDFDEYLPLSAMLVRKHKTINIYTKLLDAHLYLMKKWVLEFLASNKSIHTIKGELVPLLVKHQKTRLNENVKKSKKINSVILKFAEEDELTKKVRETSSWNDHSGDWYGPYHDDAIRCYAFVEPENIYGSRINTITAYCTANIKIKSIWTRITNKEEILNDEDQPDKGNGEGKEVKAGLKGAQKDLIETCLIDAKAQVSSKCHIISTNIGANAIIEPKSKINSCVIMPGAKISEKCELKNCIIFDDAVVGLCSSLTDCIVGKKFSVPPEESSEKKVLTEKSHLMEI